MPLKKNILHHICYVILCLFSITIMLQLCFHVVTHFCKHSNGFVIFLPIEKS